MSHSSWNNASRSSGVWSKVLICLAEYKNPAKCVILSFIISGSLALSSSARSGVILDCLIGKQRFGVLRSISLGFHILVDRVLTFERR